jgi:aminoglycoside phosphotransferase family enzyme
MFLVTLRTGKRSTREIGFFTNEDVANYVAGATDPAYEDQAAEVSPVVVNTSDSIEDWRAGLLAVIEQQEQEALAALYESLSAKDKTLLSKYADQLADDLGVTEPAADEPADA